MRLHRLRITAFGPFAGTEEVDLDALSAQGLFLLHGPTGAGKTSVLDAVCFALYGQVPGARASGGRLRSDHAAEGVGPEVLCELTAAGRRLEVTRSPAWDRPKKRGTGTTTQPAATRVRELVNGEWVARTSRTDEAAQLLDDVLGMGLEQFTRVVLLPQGEFSAFLRARAEDRRPLLQRLFGTDRFAAVERWLAQRATDLRRTVETADTEVSRLVDRAHQAASGLPSTILPTDDDVLGSSGPSSHPVQDPDADPAGHLEALHSRARVAATAMVHEEERARTELTAAEGRVTSVRRRVELLERLVAALTERAAVRRGESHVQAARQMLARAVSADTLGGHLESVAAAGQAVNVAAAAVAAAERDLAAVGEPAGRRADEAARAAAVRRQEAGRLVELLAAETELAGLVDRGRDLAERRDTATASAETLRQHVDDLAQQVVEHELVVAATADAATALADRRDELAAATVVHTAAVAADLDSAQVEQVGREVHEAVDAAQRTREAWQDLREQRLAGMAAELAGGLREHQPCVVCGSLDHPDPARAAAGAVSADQEEAARGEHEAAAEHRGALERRLAALVERRDAAVDAAGGCDAAAAETDLRSAADAVTAAQQAAARRQQACDDRDRARSLVEPLREERQEHLEALAGIDAEQVAVRDRAGVLDGRLAAARGDDPTLSARRERLLATAERLEALAGADTALREAQVWQGRTQSAAATAAGRAGFVDVAAAVGATLDTAERERLGTVVREHDERRCTVAATLAEPAVAAVAGAGTASDDGPEADEGPDVGDGPGEALAEALAARDRLDTEVAVGRQRLEEATGRHALAARALAELADLDTHVAAAVAASAPLRAREALVADLAACAAGTGGDNSLRMRLSAFVLAARLEQVADAATVRLTDVSGGRYALRHSDSAERGGARSGLGLVVLDAWTGVERDPATLSGGEAFLASLSLALGLADVLQAEAGGAAIETLFVDEGFGTLDEESLEEAMVVLDGLREGGRAVGVVSHVVDLRHRVPARLEVTKTRSGSRLHPALGAA